MKKTLSILLSLLLLFAFSSTALAGTANGYDKHGVKKELKEQFASQVKNQQANNARYQFKDTNNHWATKSIDLLSATGLFNGYPDGTFHPDQSITQAESIALLMRLVDDQNIDDNNTQDDEKDIPAWAKSSCKKAANRGIINLNRFHSGVQADRAQIAVWIAKALGLEPVDTSDMPFSDGLLISKEDVGYILALYKEGLMVGTPDGKFNPNRYITRAEMATILERILEEGTANNDLISIQKTATIVQGETLDLGATVDFSTGLKSSDYDLIWNSSNKYLATVDENGIVTAADNKTGTVTIKVTATNKDDDSTLSATCNVTVSKEVTDGSISLQKTATIVQGKTLDLGATVDFSTGLRSSDYDLTWNSGNEYLATVDEDGIITAADNRTGTVYIKVTAVNKDDDSTLSATCKVTVVEEDKIVSADLERTGNVGIHNNKIYEEYELTADGDIISLDDANVEKMTLTKDDNSPVTLTPDSNSTLWFNVQKASATYVLRVEDKNGVVYQATLNWKAPTKVDANLIGDEEINNIDYQKYAFEDLNLSNVDNIYQIDPNGDASKITSTTDYLRFKTNNANGEYVYLILDGHHWYTATIDYQD